MVIELILRRKSLQIIYGPGPYGPRAYGPAHVTLIRRLSSVDSISLQYFIAVFANSLILYQILEPACEFW